MNADIQEKIKSILADEEFVSNLSSLEEPEDVRKAFEDRGVELSVEDITKMRDILAKNAENPDGELSEDELEDVAGGELITICTLIGVAIGGAVGGGLFFSRIRRW